MACSQNPLILHTIFLRGGNPPTACPLCGEDLEPADVVTEAPTSSSGAVGTAQVITAPRAGIAAVLKKTITAGRDLRKVNCAIGGGSKSKLPMRQSTLQTVTTPPAPAATQKIKLLLKIAHLPYHLEDGVDTGTYVNHTKNRVFTLPIKETKEYTFDEFTKACVDLCKGRWPSKRWSDHYLSVFLDDSFSDHAHNEWKVCTGHLSHNDVYGANLLPMPKWPLDDEDPKAITIAEILSILSFIDGAPLVVGKGKSKATTTPRDDQIQLTIVYEYLVEDRKSPLREDSIELGTHDFDSIDSHSLLIHDDAIEDQPPVRQVGPSIDPTPTASSSIEITPAPSAATLSVSTASHKRGISTTTAREEREQEEVTERSRSGRLLRPTKKASSLSNSTTKCMPSLTSTSSAS